jgi:16S rRNA (guanine966-N2)-methyltransferase
VGPARSNELRIIGGTWRGRRLRFPAVGALRPSPDRVRETLFNWLQWVIPGARCLDLFAGSGALGFEAVSRGADLAVLVDRDPRVVAVLRANAGRLTADRVRIVEADAEAYLQRTGQPFDIVFLDPPYRSPLLERCAALLEQNGWLAPSAHIYLEAPAAGGAPVLPERWRLVHSQRAGQVGYHLAATD